MSSKVALVTGASRGVGKGISVALGAAGWTVWVTGRSSRLVGPTGTLPGLIEETADEVTAAGGTGVPVRCDHASDGQTRGLLRRIEAESGRLDLLVNNVWGGYEQLLTIPWAQWSRPFWEQPLDLWDASVTRGTRARFVTTALAAPLMARTRRSLVVTISSRPGRPAGDGEQAPVNVAYGVGSAADERLAVLVAAQLRPFGVSSVAVRPGLVRTEAVSRFAGMIDLTGSRSPGGVGRALAALARDRRAIELSGQVLDVDELAARYGVDVRS